MRGRTGLTARYCAVQGGLGDRTVLVRARFEDGIGEDLVDTVVGLVRRGARVAIVAGYGRPPGEFVPSLSLRRFVEPLECALLLPVIFVADSVGLRAESGLARVAQGGVALLENLRFHSEARRHGRAFAYRLSALADHFVVTGALPDGPAIWMSELAALLPEPPIEIPTPAMEGDRPWQG